jgi:hypothetical protein
MSDSTYQNLQVRFGVQESRHPIIFVLIASLLIFGVVVVESAIQKGLLGAPRIRPSVRLTGPFYNSSLAVFLAGRTGPFGVDISGHSEITVIDLLDVSPYRDGGVEIEIICKNSGNVDLQGWCIQIVEDGRTLCEHTFDHPNLVHLPPDQGSLYVGESMVLRAVLMPGDYEFRMECWTHDGKTCRDEISVKVQGGHARCGP